MKSDQPFLAHIADSIAAIETFVASGREAFLAERMIQGAVIRNFEVIGEAAARPSPTLRHSGDVSWREVIAFCNRLIHGYWNVDLRLVWDVIENELPRRKAAITQLLEEPSGQ